jgi:hypothetical protein
MSERARPLQEQLDIEASIAEAEEGFDDWDVFADSTDDEEDEAA